MNAAHVTCGYLPLVDSAPLIIAKELGLAAQEGLGLELAQQPSWSALRDRLIFGQIEFAHMLSPMPIAMSLGIGGVSARIDALMVLSVNGSVIGVSQALAERMSAAGWANRLGDPAAVSAAVFGAAEAPLRIGVPFPFSMHRLLTEYWLMRDPAFRSEKISLITIPPPQMAQAVRDGRIDMFCVGEPWGSVAVQQSDATLVLPSSAIWQFSPEKVLGARQEWVADNAVTSLAMIRAIYRATQWLAQPQNIPLAVEILARSQHLDLPDHAIEPALTGRIIPELGRDPIEVPGFVGFHEGAANFPWRSQAQWIARQLGAGASDAEQAETCFRSDLYRDALTAIGADLPKSSAKSEGAMAHPTEIASAKGAMVLGPDTFFDGAVFDFSRSGVTKN
ncbi:MAG: CmpA/NrtA family ABC transporter substrate-binding protein [Marinosulfonomonas sp.]